MEAVGEAVTLRKYSVPWRLREVRASKKGALNDRAMAGRGKVAYEGGNNATKPASIRGPTARFTSASLDRTEFGQIGAPAMNDLVGKIRA